jgi:uncharacterized protein YggE
MFESIISGPFPFRTMTLSGQGRITLVPDIAVIRLGVQLTGADLSEVQSRNAMQSQAVLAALRRMGITDIRTYQYTIDKYYETINGTSVDRGFTVRNILEIRTEETGQIGAVIDAAVQAGANAVDLISFEVSDPERHYQEALDLAVADAIEKAKSIAAELEIRVEEVPVRITETSTIPRPFQPFQRELASTPIVPGNVTVEANISAEFVY